MDIKVILILTLSCAPSLVQSKSFEEAMDEFIEVISEIGTGICSGSKFEEMLNNAKECQQLKRSELITQSDCEALESVYKCYDHFDACYTSEDLDKFKGRVGLF